ncbi:hypothetical protein C0993_003451 [Termitomyces sp. T159_Od127]|nr:hypothetical protein C0993_003451 [Termitomyces sp. T159_Od127]
MRLRFSASRIRQARKSRAFSGNPDVITGAAAVLATFVYRALVLHRPSATISTPTAAKLLPAVPATPTSPLPPTKTIPSPHETGSMCTLAAGGVFVFITFATTAAIMIMCALPHSTPRRRITYTSHGGDDDDLDYNDGGLVEHSSRAMNEFSS